MARGGSRRICGDERRCAGDGILPQPAQSRRKRRDGRSHWGRGYATEAARLALLYGFETLALAEIVSCTSVTNPRSRAVMERLGMRRDPADDHPTMPEHHPLRPHVLYRMNSDDYFAGD
jgi:RimJ/RimL family protein N-acetyltransferase